MAVGSGSVVAGLVAARQWALAPGGSIVLAATACFAVVAVVASPRSGAT
jgi:ABC-type Mn2+/Zn2+ transport system permease subunit